MKRQNVLFSVLAAVVLGGGIWWYATQYTPAPKSSSTTNQNQNTNAEIVLPTSVTYQGVDGQNALDLLKASHAVVEDNGFVQSIDGRPNSNTTYWFLYVNGTSSQVGAKDVQTKSTDTLEWRFEEYKAE
ncbi:MAG: DUF4430 domain-containing protein [Candidatus Kerfeldbacteria bacterium]|nr:DUF4430 domain-containing protein [Candidatus Kerfeldbacteria bacterium]